MSLQQASFDLNTEALAFINGKGTTDTNFLRISSESIIGDQYWDFFTSYINRPASISRAKLVVDWSSYHYIPLEIISELKTVFGLYYLVPEKVRTAKRIKPNSLISTIRSVCRFLDGYFGEISNELGLSNVSTKIADISISSLRKYTRSSNLRMGEVKKGLQIIGHPAFSEYIGKVQFNEYDVKTLSSKHNPVARRSLEESPFLPDDLFNLLSSQATAVVSEFLDGMGIDRMDKSLMQKAIIKPPTGVFRHIEAYIDYRLLARRDVDSRSASKASKGSRRTGSEGIEANAICSSIRRHMEVGLIRDYIRTINIAAGTIIALFTGARYSELASFEIGCLVETDGVKVLRGRNFKTGIASKWSEDKWIAIPIVEDAVSVLTFFARLKRNKFLLSSTDTNGVTKKNDGPFGSVGLLAALRAFVQEVDVDEKFVSQRLHIHQFRHTLTRQLLKAGLGLAFVSFQLKHVHSQLNSLPNDVTLAYGGAIDGVADRSLAEISSGLEVALIQDINDPDTPVMGKGGEIYAKRRQEYFEGLMAAGMTKEEILIDLKKVASPFVNVGLGYCAGSASGFSDSPSSPPCIGSLKCNPVECSNAVVTEDNVPQWKAVLDENTRMMNDPEFFYATDSFKAAADEAVRVLKWVEERS